MARSSRLSVCLAIVMRNSSKIDCARICRWFTPASDAAKVVLLGEVLKMQWRAPTPPLGVTSGSTGGLYIFEPPADGHRYASRAAPAEPELSLNGGDRRNSIRSWTAHGMGASLVKRRADATRHAAGSRHCAFRSVADVDPIIAGPNDAGVVGVAQVVVAPASHRDGKASASKVGDANASADHGTAEASKPGSTETATKRRTTEATT